MRSLGSLIGFLFIVGLIIKFIWWILGAIALVLLFFVMRSIVRSERAVREANARRCAELVAHAEEQHRWILEGDDRGIYGQYPVPDIYTKTGDLHR